MYYPNTTKQKSPLLYPLSTPVYGVDENVDFLVNGLGFRRKWRNGASESHKNMHGYPTYVYNSGGTSKIMRNKLPSVARFTYDTYPARRLCTLRWKLPFRANRMESCNNLC